MTVYADHDKPGLNASRALCQRFAACGRYAELVRPQASGMDLADLAGSRAIPHEGTQRPNDLGKSDGGPMDRGG